MNDSRFHRIESAWPRSNLALGIRDFLRATHHRFQSMRQQAAELDKISAEVKNLAKSMQEYKAELRDYQAWAKKF
ncbi:hypothetical protein [Methylosinus trichosporium]|uniref:hypothetical protein n=1 Tax=Methylosinus TaxID=425 RepID=UPI0001D2EF92|nr:hypothetical protein [Methylosinus trichosporium]